MSGRDEQMSKALKGEMWDLQEALSGYGLQMAPPGSWDTAAEEGDGSGDLDGVLSTSPARLLDDERVCPVAHLTYFHLASCPWCDWGPGEAHGRRVII